MTEAQTRPFGVLDGTEIREITLRSATGAEARILTYGAVIRDLVVPAKAGLQRVALGLDTIDDYVAHSPYFGAVPGRFANRIADGRFTLDGKTFDLDRNEGGITTLHGGSGGFGKRVWTVASSTPTSVTLALHSSDGDQGFPGALEATCTYTLLEPATLRFELHATTEAPTIVNLTNHTYFNLDGSADILEHALTLHAAQMTPVDDRLIPTGAIVPVAGTAFDFRTARPIRHASGQGYDHNFVIDGGGRGAMVHAARVHSSRSGVTLDVHTDQPGIQFYDAAKLDCPVKGLGGAHYGRNAGLCLETQNFPDAPNQPTFPSATLRPGERYSNTTEFRFS